MTHLDLDSDVQPPTTAQQTTDKILYFTRHAQAEHNVAEDWSIPDAPLTPLGFSQSRALHLATKDTFQRSADLLVSSPLRRPLQTLLHGFPDLHARVGTLVMPELQEVKAHPCDTGSEREVLEAIEEFGGIDFSGLEEGWNGKEGIYKPEKVLERARVVRRWLREREEKEIVVVCHGEFLRNLTNLPLEKAWANAEVRAFRFVSHDDEDAHVFEIEVVAKEGKTEPTSGEFAV